MELTETVFEHNGCKLHYWTGGRADSPVVVFSHGATIDHHEWDPTLPLVGERFRIMTWDLRGHGLSRPPKFQFSEAVADLKALLDRLGIQKATLVGHSMGGNINQEFAFRHPDRVQALAMLDTTWNFKPLSASDKFWLKLADPIFALYPYSLLIEQSVAVSATSKESQDLLRKAMRQMSKDEFVQVLMDATSCLREEPGYKIKAPLLLMMGERESTGNIRTAMPLWAKHDGVDLIVIPNAKHGANLDQPEIFHRLLLDFLRQNAK